MSADNCIAIASFPTNDGWEFRVAHCQNIEDCFCIDLPLEVEDAFRVVKFWDAPSFTTMEKAVIFACNLAEGYDVLEYGVMELPPFERPLNPMSEQEACQVIDHHFSANYD